MTEITKEMETKYLEDNGTVCPFCGHDEVLSGAILWSSAIEAYADVRCKKCNKEWKDLYSITGIREIK